MLDEQAGTGPATRGVVVLQNMVVTDLSGGRSQPVAAGGAAGQRTAADRVARASRSAATWRAAVTAHPSAWRRDDVGAQAAVELDGAASMPPASAPAAAGMSDAGTSDAGISDAGTRDAGTCDAGMSTVEYAVGTVVATAFAAVLYKIVTGDSVVAGLTNLINSALSTTF